MFKGIVIELTEPICNCETENLSWGFEYEGDDATDLYVLCESCGSKLIILYENLVASITLDTSYPKKQKKSEPEPKSRSDAKIIPFPNSPKDKSS
tara:strand:+ start:223 stop:507 length:285 start_codon:yes stop_codon:yes gene_type:complete